MTVTTGTSARTYVPHIMGSLKHPVRRGPVQRRWPQIDPDSGAAEDVKPLGAGKTGEPCAHCTCSSFPPGGSMKLSLEAGALAAAAGTLAIAVPATAHPGPGDH